MPVLPMDDDIFVSQVSPPLFECIEMMKREDIVARIDYTLATVFGDEQ